MTVTSLMLAPQANTTYVCTSGTPYTSDVNSIIANIANDNDVTDLQNAGCFVLTPPPTDLIASLKGANFNSTSDQVIPLTFKGANFRVKCIVVVNTSVNGMSTAEGGVYTAAAKATGQGVLVANSQVYTGLTNAVTADELTLALPNLVLTAGTLLYFSLTTPQGATATADIYVYGDVYK